MRASAIMQARPSVRRAFQAEGTVDMKVPQWEKIGGSREPGRSVWPECILINEK